MTQMVHGLRWGCTRTASPGLTPPAWGLDALCSARAPEDGCSLPPARQRFGGSGQTLPWTPAADAPSLGLAHISSQSQPSAPPPDSGVGDITVAASQRGT